MDITIYDNITFDYDGEGFLEKGKLITELSVPMIMDTETGLCRYKKSFSLQQTDDLIYPKTKSVFFDNKKPFYPGGNPTMKPTYAVPASMQ